jgi:hypothetical protein
MPHDSYRQLESTLRDFASETEPRALLLRGEWGTGKTYACIQALRAKKEKKQIPFSYVSLYGIGTPNDIYARIALGWNNSVTRIVPDWLKETLGAAGGKALKGFADVIKMGGVIDAIGTASVGLMARNTLIVIDDLERRDEKLSVTAALGVVSYLIESRGCRVIFISNDDALNPADKEAFDSQKEKVFDAEFIYSPTVEENASLFAAGNADYILAPLRALDVCNIRVIRRVSRFLDDLRFHLDKKNERSNEIVLKNASILAILYHGFRSKVDLDARKTANELIMMRLMDGKEAKPSDNDLFFEKTGYFTGPADDEIVEYLRTGRMDWSALNRKLENQEEYFKREEVRRQFQHVFDRCYLNFIATTDEVVEKLKTACRENAELATPSALQFAATTLKNLGQPEDLQGWLTRWETKNIPILTDNEIQEALEGISSYPESTQKKIREEASRRRGNPNIDDVLFRRFSQKVYSTGSLKELAALPLADYQKWLEETDSPHIRSLVGSVFEQFYGKPAPEGDIANKVLEAVELLAKKSSINQLRADRLKEALPDAEKET